MKSLIKFLKEDPTVVGVENISTNKIKFSMFIADISAKENMLTEEEIKDFKNNFSFISKKFNLEDNEIIEIEYEKDKAIFTVVGV